MMGMCWICNFAANIFTPRWGQAASASTMSPTSTIKTSPSHVTTAPVSPLGQKLYIKTRYATAVATPTTLGVDPLRTHQPENEEQSIHLMYGFLYVADK